MKYMYRWYSTRQAAAEGLDVWSWVASRRRSASGSSWPEAWAGMLAPGEEGLGQRLAWAQEDQRARLQAGQGTECVGEAVASRGFWEAAQWRGAEGQGSSFSMIDEVE